MYLTLWVVFLALGLLIISIGLFRPEHTEMAIIGFVFLFLLGLNLETGSIDYKIGTQTNLTYSNLTGQQLVITEDTKDIYETFTAGNISSHIIGYWLMVMSVVGFIGILISIRAQRFN